MSRFAIFGSGFGLYGYLPALVTCGQQIVLPERYKTRYHSRPELTSFNQAIEWQTDEQTALDTSSGVLLSLQPAQQYKWLPFCLAKKNIDYLLLEKPLAKSPADAMLLFQLLKQAKKKYRIGYLFRLTPWGQILLTHLKHSPIDSRLSIKWHFMAHHFRHGLTTWKRSHTEGGSVLRFYGIHIIALLAELGYQQVMFSELSGSTFDESENWQAHFSGPLLPDCTIEIATRSSHNLFQISGKGFTDTQSSQLFVNLSDPFDIQQSSNTLDKRVPLLITLCHSLFNSTDAMDWYEQAIILWSAAEQQLSYKEVIYE